MNEYDLGYFEGIRAVALMYNRHLKQVTTSATGIELQLQSEEFVTELYLELKEAKELRDRK
tara:strand:- start:598 stop:780 length:183 start_codon:yes stop_codon:yes gene_type:complete